MKPTITKTNGNLTITRATILNRFHEAGLSTETANRVMKGSREFIKAYNEATIKDGMNLLPKAERNSLSNLLAALLELAKESKTWPISDKAEKVGIQKGITAGCYEAIGYNAFQAWARKWYNDDMSKKTPGKPATSTVTPNVNEETGELDSKTIQDTVLAADLKNPLETADTGSILNTLELRLNVHPMNEKLKAKYMKNIQALRQAFDVAIIGEAV